MNSSRSPIATHHSPTHLSYIPYYPPNHPKPEGVRISRFGAGWEYFGEKRVFACNSGAKHELDAQKRAFEWVCSDWGQKCVFEAFWYPIRCIWPPEQKTNESLGIIAESPIFHLYAHRLIHSKRMSSKCEISIWVGVFAFVLECEECTLRKHHIWYMVYWKVISHPTHAPKIFHQVMTHQPCISRPKTLETQMMHASRMSRGCACEAQQRKGSIHWRFRALWCLAIMQWILRAISACGRASRRGHCRIVHRNRVVYWKVHVEKRENLGFSQGLAIDWQMVPMLCSTARGTGLIGGICKGVGAKKNSKNSKNKNVS